MKYVDVVIDNKSRQTDMGYTYECADDGVCVGQKVYVPFARSKALREGYVIGVRDNPEKDMKFKAIDHFDENIVLNQEMIDTALWMKKRYLVKAIDGIGCFIPPGKAPSRKLKEKKRIEASEEPHVLTKEQSAAVMRVAPVLERREHEIFLLHGVTSSGKTEVYMQLIDRVIKDGRTAIMMVPEISLTRQIIERFEKRFGSDSIAIMHSRLTKPQRYSQWLRIRSGEVKIVIGARSAVFAPLENIGLIIMDEEHENTYKSDQTPKYETIEVAIKRAKAHDASIILGSATPSAVSYSRAEEGIYSLIEMKKRYNENLMPEVSVVDMKDEMRAGNRSILSRKLHDSMKDCLERGQQVILFLNRRGFAGYISCRECGHTFTCPECGISMTYHKDINGLSCHYCGRTRPLPDSCPECGGKLKFGGMGTQKLEEEIGARFPEYRADRLDLDAVKRVGSLERILSDFRKGKTQILIGTQLVAKGLDFDNVGLVGIVAADNGLNIPDYRSCERTFQLITQASGRAGRGDDSGKVIIQTFSPEHYAVVAAAANDYAGFIAQEIDIRRMMSYPPYADIIRVLFTGEDERHTYDVAMKAYSYITGITGREKVFTPQPAHMSKIGDTYRYSMMIKCPKGRRNLYLGACNGFMEKLTQENEKVNMGVDINPYSFT